MLSCKDAVRAVTSDDLADAGWRKRWAIRIHLFLCPPCHVYARQIHALGDAVRGWWGDQKVEKERLERLEKALFEEIDRR